MAKQVLFGYAVTDAYTMQPLIVSEPHHITAAQAFDAATLRVKHISPVRITDVNVESGIVSAGDTKYLVDILTEEVPL